MKKLQWLLKKLKKLINFVDDPVDNLKHWLWHEWNLKNGWIFRVRVPMKNKKYYGFEAVITKRKEIEK